MLNHKSYDFHGTDRARCVLMSEPYKLFSQKKKFSLVKRFLCQKYYYVKYVY